MADRLAPGDTAPDFTLPDDTGSEVTLSDLRSRIAELEKRREHLIDEMKAKNLDTAGLSLD